MKLSIITLTFNKLDYTKKFIESLYKYTNDFELIVVDNGSTDGTVEYLQTLPNIKLILNQENLGYSKGNNQGIEYTEGEYIAFLNNDILLYPNWFEACEEVFEKEKAGFVSPRQIESNKIRFKKEYQKNFDKCEFSCVVTKKCILEKIGVFDEAYSPAFFEDNDLKYRAIEAGYGVFVTNKACYYHYGSVTSKNLDQNLNENRDYYYSKFPFAEYLSVIAEERDECQRIINDFNRFPLNFIYKIFLIPRKIRNYLRRKMRERT